MGDRHGLVAGNAEIRSLLVEAITINRLSLGGVD
ncbi:MAG: hypothetical protein QOE70_207 [Chthoniobacter sp.]|nr:hypothetical protein [Chthoniobacter sp.]